MATDLERLVVQLSADIKKYENAMNRATGIASKRASELERRFGQAEQRITESFGKIGDNATRSLNGAFSNIAALASSALSVGAIVNYSDAWTEAGNKINAASQIAGVNSRSLNQLKDDANSARTELTSYVDLYAKLIRSASAVAKSEEEISIVTQTVSKAFKAGGAAANEQAAGILQLGQALGSGVLQGDELRSLRENAPIIADAIAKEFQTTIAGLKQLGSEGKLTSDRVFKAILNAQKPIEAAFKTTNATIKDAMTQINNEFTAYIGNADRSSGASRKLVAALNYLAENFKEVGDVVLQFVTIITAALIGRGLVALGITLANTVVSLGAFITAVRTGTAVAATLTASLGPIGLIAGAAAAAIYLLSDSLSTSEQAAVTHGQAVAQNETALDAAKKSSEGYTAQLRSQIAMQYEAAKASFQLAYAEFNAARQRAENFRTLAKSLTGLDLKFDPFEYAANSADKNATEIGLAAYKLGEQLRKIDEEQGGFDSGYGKGLASTGTGDGKEKLNAYEKEIEKIKERTSAINAETEAQAKLNPLVNDYGYAVEFARAKHDLLAAAKEAEIAITPQIEENIRRLADAYAQSGVAAEKLAESQDKIRERQAEILAVQKDVTRGLVDDLLEGKSAAESFANALKKIGSALLDSAFNSLFSSKSSGGIGGILGLLGFADGGYTGAGGKYEPAGVVHKGEYVIPKNIVDKVGVKNIQSAFGGYANGGLVGGAPSMPKFSSAGQSTGGITYAPNIDARGADVAAVERLERAMARDRQEFGSRVIATVQKAKGSNIKGV